MHTSDDIIYFRTVVFTKYEDIKKVFEMEQASGRPTSAPMNKTRPGWYTFTQFDPENNTNRTPSVILSQVKYIDMEEIFSLIVSCICFHRESIGKSIGDSF